jgi:CheY-like chemotaxis protein/anti-sigma regulatory factor (Ser/Thr protein kinase)
MGALEKRQEDGLRKILEQSQNLVRLINQLLDVRAFSRGECRPAPEAVSLSTMMTSRLAAVAPLFEKKGVTLEISPASGALEVLADPADLTKVIDHVMSNALKFTPKGGRVRVEMGEESRRAVVRVTDTGNGIPPESLRFVFQKFFHVDQTLTRDYGGMGLGLAFCKEAVDAMGGGIRVESDGVGRGTRVVLSLPTAADPSMDAEAKTVLWVDDNPNMLELVETGFSGINRSVTVKTAHGGIPALTSLKAFRPDLIVLDIMMSDMDGLEVLSRIKADAATAKIPVLIVSGYKEAARTAVQRGADDYCLKPFRVADVIKKIDTLLFPPRSDAAAR